MRFCSESGGSGKNNVFNVLILTPPIIPDTSVLNNCKNVGDCKYR